MGKSQQQSSASPADEQQIIVGLDIGTSKVCAIVAARDSDGPVAGILEPRYQRRTASLLRPMRPAN